MEKNKKEIKPWDVLLDLVIKNNWKIGAEIGVKRGHTTCHLVENKKDLHMYAVDPWIKADVEPYNDWDHDENYKIFYKRAEPNLDRITILKTFSSMALSFILNSYLDFVYIDADHRYEEVCADIRHWMLKVKYSGWILGHDYRQKDVKKAVEDSFKSTNLKLKIYPCSIWSVKLDYAR